MPHTLTFTLSPEQFGARQQEIAKTGLTIPPGNEGTIEYKGVKFAYSYDGTNQLTVTVLHKPRLVPEGLVDAKLRQWFREEI